MRKTLGAAFVGTVAAGLLLTSGTVGATPPGPGVTAKTITQQTAGGKDYILREITLPPHQSTGWHMHKWPIYGWVQKGTLSHFDSTCESDGVYKPGSTISEPANYVHIGRNLGDTPVVLDVLYVVDHGGPLSVDEPNPGCDFQ